MSMCKNYKKGDLVYDYNGYEYIYDTMLTENKCVVYPVVRDKDSQGLKAKGEPRIISCYDVFDYDTSLASKNEELSDLNECINEERAKLIKLNDVVKKIDMKLDRMIPSNYTVPYMQFLAALNPFLDKNNRPRYIVLGPINDYYDISAPGIIDTEDKDAISELANLTITVDFDFDSEKNAFNVHGQFSDKYDDYKNYKLTEDRFAIAYTLEEAKEKLIQQSVIAAKEAIKIYEDKYNHYCGYRFGIISLYETMKKMNIPLDGKEFYPFRLSLASAIKEKMKLNIEERNNELLKKKEAAIKNKEQYDTSMERLTALEIEVKAII